MPMNPDSSRSLARVRPAPIGAALGLLICATVGGCPTNAPMDNLTASPISNDSTATFADAAPSGLDKADQVQFDGTISSGSDVDLFDLGTLTPGDLLFVDVSASSGDLDPVAAIFDDREFLQAFNDDRNPDATNLNPQLDIVIRGRESQFFLGVAAFPGGSSTGDYHVEVRVARGAGDPNPKPQIVYLNWAGGQNIVIPNVDVFNLNPFDAARLNLPGMTAALEDQVQQIIQNRYSGYNLIVRNSKDDLIPTEPHSTVHFGGVSSRAFAISEQIDTQNADPSDSAIVFTDSFTGAFGRTLSFTEMSRAVGNTAAHEIGHLVGLVHTKDCNSLMDTTCGNTSLLRLQSFRLAPLDVSVFPFGFQEATELITWALGMAGM